MDRRSSTSSSRFRRHLGHFAVALAVVVVVETVLGRVAPQSPMVAEFSAQRARFVTAPAPDIEILGDSVAYAGIEPNVLADALVHEHSVENRALPGSGPAFQYFLLRDQIAAGHVPRAIIWAHAPHTYAGTRFGVLIGRFCRWHELGVLAANGCAGDDMLYGVLNQLSYSLAYRDQIQDAMKGDLTYFREAGRMKRRRPPGQGLMPVARGTFEPRGRGDAFEMSDFNRKFTGKTFALAAEHGIRVYFATVPESATSFARREPTGFYDGYRSTCSELAADAGRILSRETLVYEDSLFADPTHLTREGAERYTRDLAEQLNAALDDAPAPAGG
jgi:hypothetical protein